MHDVSVFIQSCFTLHNCSGVNLIASPRDSSAGKSFPQCERTSRRRPWVRLTEGGKEMCGCESVIMNIQTMCRHAVASAWVSACHWTRAGDYAIAAAVWRASAHTIRTPGFGRCLALLNRGVGVGGGLQSHILVTNSGQGMCRIKAGQTIGSSIHLFSIAQGSQTANPLSECLLSQRAQT